MSPFESFSKPVIKESPEKKEELAEQELQKLLEHPDNSFLNEVHTNRDFIDNSDTAIEALEFAKKKIKERLERSGGFHAIKTIEGVSVVDVNFESMKRTMDTILANQVEIGRGMDAFVVIDKNEIRDLPPEICYKFTLTESIPRDRNSVQTEAEMQGLFYDVAQKNSESKIGVPIPFYVIEIGNKKMIAMEKLNARSITDLIKQDGRLPTWFDVDIFCEELRLFIDRFHQSNLYHRDMHFGNIMISQAEEIGEGEKWGHVIDFGLSKESETGEGIYEKQFPNETFTYHDDYAIIEEVNKHLKKLQNREL